MQHSEWATPPTEELREIEYTQLEEKNDKGSNGNGNQSVPINGGIAFVLIIAIFIGLWKQYRTSQHSTSES